MQLETLSAYALISLEHNNLLRQKYIMNIKSVKKIFETVTILITMLYNSYLVFVRTISINQYL